MKDRVYELHGDDHGPVEGLAQAAHDGEVIYLTRGGERVAAVVPTEVADYYEQLEDRHDDQGTAEKAAPAGGAAAWDEAGAGVWVQAGTLTGRDRPGLPTELGSYLGLTPDVERAVRASAERAGISVSQWIARVAEQAAKIEDGLRAVAEYEAEFGPLPEQSRRHAREALVRAGLVRQRPARTAS